MSQYGALWIRISQLCLQLSNSGKALKLIIPNFYYIIISGWINYSGKVTSYKNLNKDRGNRGTKSAKIRVVKAQRVYGNWVSFGKKDTLRSTLMGSERNSQIRNLSVQFNKSFFSTYTAIHNTQLNPYFVTGFCDAESSFQVIIIKLKSSKLGWSVRSLFTIGLHSRDLELLLQIKNFLDCGIIVKDNSQNKVYLRVNSLQDLTKKIIPHFTNYPLLTQKAADFNLFKLIIELMVNKAHLSTEGLQEIINIKASMNLGLSEDLNYNFPNTTPIYRPTIKTTNIPHFSWVSGFVSGDGNFFVDMFKSDSNKIGYQVKLRLSITQHSRDKELLELIVKYLNAGIVNIHSKNAFVLKITKFTDLTNNIIPLLEKNPIHGVKQLEFLDFCKVAKLMGEGKHHTIDGLKLIRIIKNNMNTKRKMG